MTDILNTYKDVETYFAKARDKEKGRPLASWGRVKKNGDTYEVWHGGSVLGKYTPDNKFTFTMTPQQARNHSITLSQALHRAIPFMWIRVATGRYAVVPNKAYQDHCEAIGSNWDWRFCHDKRNQVELFDGLQFDLSTFQPTNARPALLENVDEAKRKHWLSCLRSFKRGMKVRARMGVLEGFCQQVIKENSGKGRYQWQQPDWSSDKWLDVLYTSIKDNQFPNELMMGFVQSSTSGYWQTQPTPALALHAVDQVCKTYSVELRRRFGVFDATQGE